MNSIDPDQLAQMCKCIGLDKSGYQINSFLISPQKNMLWVLIRFTEALLMSTHNINFHGELENSNTFGLKKASYQEI